jgi:hypothetical protein
MLLRISLFVRSWTSGRQIFFLFFKLLPPPPPPTFFLIFIPCIIKRIENNQPYALILHSFLLHTTTPTCVGNYMPSSGSI